MKLKVVLHKTYGMFSLPDEAWIDLNLNYNWPIIKDFRDKPIDSIKYILDTPYGLYNNNMHELDFRTDSDVIKVVENLILKEEDPEDYRLQIEEICLDYYINIKSYDGYETLEKD